ncbi:PREDICTED: deleted in autism-related protein 1 [Dipodomys ordii]|uniref:Deleted in autism-related protein 1 n=1 Tax=Dipodomys ordii TaxID=10020 RepID=A0A1S3GDI3_DIPOR|nr:PREDICTED: deleted in autism-related protein 1 [Dipodomys ordii]
MDPQLGPEAAALHPGWQVLLLLVVSVVSCFSSPASPPPSLVSRVRTSYNLGRTFLGLDKCNACIGTSICKKFFKEEIRFDNSLASDLELASDYLPSYSANYSDDSKTWRPVEIFRLVSKEQNEISDRRICAFASAPKTCSIERILRKTGRFQKWLQAKRLTPDLVQSTQNLKRSSAQAKDFTGSSQAAPKAGENQDIFSCLVSGCQAQLLPSCDNIPDKQSVVLVCQQLLPQLLQGKFPSPVQVEIDSALAQCGQGIRPDSEVFGAASRLKDILRPLRTCDPRFAYRYPDCKYNDRF